MCAPPFGVTRTWGVELAFEVFFGFGVVVAVAVGAPCPCPPPESTITP
ncbi:MAG: hypothetical protein JWQ95_3084, partial [Sphaerisporangium sp.]|nr:hypothetical protein [Sphaerisporangium sp.]